MSAAAPSFENDIKPLFRQGSAQRHQGTQDLGLLRPSRRLAVGVGRPSGEP
jgi:hypothetical protein